MQKRKRFFFGCEGDSERSYVRWVQRIADEHELPVFADSFDAGGGSPLRIVERSIDECQRRKRIHGRYVGHFVILDQDKMGESPSNDAKIPALLSRFKFHVLFQDPLHEALLLRHFAQTKNKRPVKARVQSELLKVWPGYRKPQDEASLSKRFDFSNLEIACTVEPELKKIIADLGFEL